MLHDRSVAPLSRRWGGRCAVHRGAAASRTASEDLRMTLMTPCGIFPQWTSNPGAVKQRRAERREGSLVLSLVAQSCNVVASELGTVAMARQSSQDALSDVG